MLRALSRPALVGLLLRRVVCMVRQWLHIYLLSHFSPKFSTLILLFENFVNIILYFAKKAKIIVHTVKKFKIVYAAFILNALCMTAYRRRSALYVTFFWATPHRLRDCPGYSKDFFILLFKRIKIKNCVHMRNER